jgi:hypothetical protein
MSELESNQLSNVVDIDEECQKKETLERAPDKKRREHFALIDRNCLQTSGLSMEAMGLISHLISLPPDWIVYVSQLSKLFGVGRYKVYKVINELISKGYMMRIKVRNAHGRFLQWRTVYSDFPEFIDAGKATESGDAQPVIKNQEVDSKTVAHPLPNLPDLAEPLLEDSTLQRNTITNKHSYKEENTPKAPSRGRRSRSSFPKEFEEFWQYYPKRKDKGRAFDKYNKLLSKEYNLHETIIAALKAQNLERIAKQSKNLWQPEPKHPTTWLNAECWNDEVINTMEQLDEEVRRADSGKSGISHKSAKLSEVMRESRKRAEAAIRSAGLTPRSQRQLSGPADARAGTPAIQQVQALLPGELDKGD